MKSTRSCVVSFLRFQFRNLLSLLETSCDVRSLDTLSECETLQPKKEVYPMCVRKATTCVVCVSPTTTKPGVCAPKQKATKQYRTYVTYVRTYYVRNDTYG